MADWRRSTLQLAILSFSAGITVPALGQDADVGTRAERLTLEEVVVTARRRVELLQDVPISMTVFSQQQLSDNNIINSGDLATYTPSLQTNTRFGGDNTSFAIRGFSQEFRTTASVGVFFADVVALRGANAQQSGDGAGPGDFFDLASVQVLKGPTGTLFGRNTTGGAVLLTPNKPIDEFEAYIEGGAGNYDMGQGQAMLNVPLSDVFKLRFAIDHQQRDGYLDNISGIGPQDFADVDYTAYRLSSLWDITDAIENYTILRYTDSDNNGYPGSIFACNPAEVFGSFCEADLAQRTANGANSFYDVYNFIPDPVNKTESAQIINATTWEINDDLLVKNILSYGTLETKQRSSIFGTNWTMPTGDFLIFQMVGLAENLPSTDQESGVEEIQLQGTAFDERLTWQGGLYYEKSQPINDYGFQSPALIACDQDSITSGNPDDFRCSNVFGVGSVENNSGGAEYTSKAIYSQGTYDLTDTVSLTAGLRYTDDKTEGDVTDTIYKFPLAPPGEFAPPDQELTQVERRTPSADSSKPTWLLGVDYTPEDDMMLYAKYTRGYRQGSVNIAGSAGLDTHGPESVDTYEIGTKTSFHGSMPATFNMALFYNDFQDQQIQFGYFNSAGVGTTGITNAGSSTIWGSEVEGNIQLTDNLIFSASYAYLHTHVDELEFPALTDSVLEGANLTTVAGEPLPFAPENKLVLTATYLLPVPADIGSMRFSTTYVYTDQMQAVSETVSPLGVMADYNLLNLNFAWERVLESPVDLSVFVTNVADEEYKTYVIGIWPYGVEGGAVGMPRMYGARIRYNFGP